MNSDPLSDFRNHARQRTVSAYRQLGDLALHAVQVFSDEDRRGEQPEVQKAVAGAEARLEHALILYRAAEFGAATARS